MRRATLLASLVALAACARPPAERPHVVLVLVDQLRLDAVERWAGRLSALGEEGIVFTSMRSVAPWTYPSVISLMSGLYPQQHGADRDDEGGLLSTFSEDVPMLAELLRDAGYATAGFVTNPYLHTWNPFHEGFDVYDVDFIESQGNLRGLGAIVWTDRMFADTVNARVRGHFDARPLDGPEFTYVHYIDVHGPWDEAPFEPTYEASVRWIDERIVEMYDYFSARYDGDVLFFVTSDHGQALGDDELVGDGRPLRMNKVSLHDFNLRIPFLVLPSRHVTRPRRVDVSCANVDFVPTLLDWLDLPLAYAAPGVSLLPAMRGEPVHGAGRVVYACVSAAGMDSDCVVHEGRKYMRYVQPPERRPVATRVFDLQDDPRETDPLEGAFQRGARLLEEAAAGRGPRFPATLEEPDPDVLERLRALGYLK